MPVSWFGVGFGFLPQFGQFEDLLIGDLRTGLRNDRSGSPLFDSLEDLLSSLEIAERYGRVLIPQFHVFYDDQPTGGTNATPADFRTFVEAVDSANVDVVTVEEFFEIHSS